VSIVVSPLSVQRGFEKENPTKLLLYSTTSTREYIGEVRGESRISLFNPNLEARNVEALDVLFIIFAICDSWVGLFSSLLVPLLLLLEDLPPALPLGAEMTRGTCLDVAGGSLRCFVVGGAASDFFFPQPSLVGVLDFLEVEADPRPCGVKDLLLGLLVCLWGVLLLLLLIEISFSLPLPIFFPSHFDFLLGVDLMGFPTDLDLRPSGSSLALSSSRTLSSPLA
jgi:hypothetical protein